MSKYSPKPDAWLPTKTVHSQQPFRAQSTGEAGLHLVSIQSDDDSEVGTRRLEKVEGTFSVPGECRGLSGT